MNFPVFYVLLGQVFGLPPVDVYGVPAQPLLAPQASVFGESLPPTCAKIQTMALRPASLVTPPEPPAEITDYVPAVIGTTADGAIANYAEARRMAAKLKGALVVVVGQPVPVLRAEEERSDAARVIVCELGESATFAPGIYRYQYRDGDLYPVGEAYASDEKGRLTPRAATPTASSGAGGLSTGSCANGQCGVPARRFLRGN